MQNSLTQWRIQGGGVFGGSIPPLKKKSSPYLGVFLWLGDILSLKPQYALDREKPFEIKHFPGGGPLDHFTVKYFLVKF